MSGSVSGRAITLTLSVANAARIQEDLRSLGTVGEESLRKLETAAQRAAGNNSVAKLATDGSEAFGGMTQKVQSAGYQLQDFAVQVQGGTSALTALSQQGSQFLGAFGTGGAIAGAVLTVGILAAQILKLSGDTETLADVTKRLDQAYKDLTSSAETWESGAKKEQASLLTLQAYYKSLTVEVRNFESARLQAFSNDLDRQAAGIRGNILSPGSGLLQSQQGEAPAYDAMGNPTGGVTGSRSNDPRTVQFTESLRVFREGALTTQSLAELDGRMRSLASGNGAVADRARDTLKVIDQARGDVEKLSESLQKLQDQRDARDGKVLPLPADFILDPDVGKSAAAAKADPDVTESYRILERALKDVDQAAGNSYEAFLKLRDGNDAGSAAATKLSDAVAILNDALDKGAISQAEYSATLGAAQDEWAKTLNLTAKGGQAVGSTFNSAFRGIESGFEAAITGGKKFGDVIKALEQDLAKLIIRQSITGPLSNALGQAIGSGMSGLGDKISVYTGGSNAAPSLQGMTTSQAMASLPATPSRSWFANGGIMTSLGPLPLNKYAGGGVARSPQVAIFGENRQAEAYVPLPDGNTIPVTMRGGGGGGNVFNIDARGADAGVEQRIDAVLSRRMPAIIAANRSDMTAQVNRGGGMARTMGRRG